MALMESEMRELRKIKQVIKGTPVKIRVSSIGKIQFSIGGKKLPLNSLGNTVGVSALRQAKAIVSVFKRDRKRR